MNAARTKFDIVMLKVRYNCTVIVILVTSAFVPLPRQSTGTT